MPVVETAARTLHRRASFDGLAAQTGQPKGFLFSANTTARREPSGDPMRQTIRAPAQPKHTLTSLRSNKP